MWTGPVRHTLQKAVDDAYDHFYCVHGTKPVLVYQAAENSFYDKLTNEFVTVRQVVEAKTFSGAFRARAVMLQLWADGSEFPRMTGLLQESAERLEEVARRLEAYSGHTE